MSQVKEIDRQNILYIVTSIIFLIGILLLTLAEPFGGNWLIGLGLLGAGVGFVILIITNNFKN